MWIKTNPGQGWSRLFRHKGITSGLSVTLEQYSVLGLYEAQRAHWRLCINRARSISKLPGRQLNRKVRGTQCVLTWNGLRGYSRRSRFDSWSIYSELIVFFRSFDFRVDLSSNDVGQSRHIEPDQENHDRAE